MKTQLNNKSKEIHLTVSYFQTKTDICYENHGTIHSPYLVPVYKEVDHVLIKSIDILIDENSNFDEVERTIRNETSDKRVHYFLFDSVHSDFVEALKQRPFIRAVLELDV